MASKYIGRYIIDSIYGYIELSQYVYTYCNLFRGGIPENTIEAFCDSKSAGASAVEVIYISSLSCIIVSFV